MVNALSLFLSMRLDAETWRRRLEALSSTAKGSGAD